MNRDLNKGAIPYIIICSSIMTSLPELSKIDCRANMLPKQIKSLVEERYTIKKNERVVFTMVAKIQYQEYSMSLI